MSQEKVDQNKKLKQNRKKIVRQNKIKRIVTAAATAVVCVALVVWIGYSFYGKYEEAQKENATAVSVDMSSITDYLQAVSGEE